MKTILVVDDTFICLLTAEKVLGEKYRVLTAKSGNSAIVALTNEHVDLILLDMDMPAMNGVETLKKIRSRSASREIPVIMVTGDDSRDSVVAVAQLQVDDYIIKPYLPEELLCRVEKVLS